MKSKVSFVSINRAEGPVAECGSVVFYVGDAAPADYDDGRGHMKGARFIQVKEGKMADAVRHQFFVWGGSAPEQGMGYDKCDFKVKWDNGLEYEGRFDLQKGGTDGRESFWYSLKNRLEAYSLRVRPARFKDAHWENFKKQMIAEGAAEFCGKVLDECEVAA